MKKSSFYLVRLTLVGLTFCLPLITRAFGVTPSNLEFVGLVNTSEVNTEFFFSRGNPEADQQVAVTIAGSGAPAIEFLDGDNITLKAGEKNTPFHFLIHPTTLSPGTYEVYFTGSIQDQAGENVNENKVQVGTLATLTFTVTNESIESFSIQSVSMGDAEQGQLIGFSFLFNNTGNVDTRPSKVEFGVVDELDPSNVYSETIPAEAIPIVPAFSQQTINLVTQANLTPGLYQTLITFYDQTGSVIYVADNIRLQVTAAPVPPVTTWLTTKNILYTSIGVCVIVFCALRACIVRKKF